MSSSQGFQTQAYYDPARAVAGDFASSNPRHSVVAGPGGIIAGVSLHTGRFAWLTSNPVDGDGAPAVANDFGTGTPAGFVHRDQQGLITTYLDEAGQQVQAGFPVTLFDGGDFFVVNDGASQALVGQKAYANFSNGKITFAATGSPTAGGTSSASTIAAKTATLTGSIAGNVLTVTAESGDPIVAGAVLGSGSGVATGSAIVSQLLPLLSGEALGGIGRYYLSIPEQTVASEAMTFTYGLLTVGGTVAGTFGLGDTVTGSGVTAGTTITQLGTGTGGAGTYYVNLTQTVGSEEIDVGVSNVETNFRVVSSGLAGELVKITSQPHA
jgi:hypothetical protein